jgi:hypothetical protein
MIVILLIEVGQINDVVLICGIKLVTVDILLLWPYTKYTEVLYRRFDESLALVAYGNNFFHRWLTENRL